MNYEKIMKSLLADRPQEYIPEFSVITGTRCFHIFDGKQAVLDFYIPDEAMLGDRYSFDIFKFSPFEEPVIANHPDPECPVLDMHTLKNSQISLPYFDAKDLVAGTENHHQHVELKWVSDFGKKIIIHITGVFSEGQRFVYEIIIDYDPARRQYRFNFKIDFFKLTPTGFEPLNFLMAGALRGRKELVRWTHSIYEDRFHNLRKIVHSNALFCATDYSEPPYWRQKSAPLMGAWVAYGCNDICNPAFIVHKNNVPLRLDTCSALFDEHLIFNEATNENIEGNYFRFSMETEFVNLNAEITKELFDNAESQFIPEKWRIDKVPLGFYLDRVNDFEEPVDVRLPEVCPVIIAERDIDAPVQRADDCGYTGTHSLKLHAVKGFAGWTEAYPQGAVCEVESHSCYRISAMVKCSGVERFARIGLAINEYRPTNRLDTAYSIKTNSEEWTLLEAVIDVGVAPYVIALFQLYGIGDAYFDEVRFEKI